MARPRKPEPVAAGELPANIAAGPDPAIWAPDAPPAARRRVAETEWSAAGTHWSIEHLHTWNGWRRLLPAKVLAADSARARLARLNTE